MLINNRPIYQFIGDRNDTDAKGIGLSDSWHALKSNGEKLLIDSFSPIDPSPNPINPIIPDPNPFPGPLPDPRLPIPGPDPITGPIKPGPTPIKNYPPEFTNFIPEFEIQENELFVYKFNVFDLYFFCLWWRSWFIRFVCNQICRHDDCGENKIYKVFHKLMLQVQILIGKKPIGKLFFHTFKKNTSFSYNLKFIHSY